ncbi:unnamed protein product [Chrysodeixis includens]|uniref:EGF-like domain-containing protein n=1 Tax=Chrysodeixis includens TaxID=689277 RepID=A0A9N8KSQ3_CHRIL|nr:unnamed protein product [Chrysodeixis includens]
MAKCHRRIFTTQPLDRYAPVRGSQNVVDWQSPRLLVTSSTHLAARLGIVSAGVVRAFLPAGGELFSQRFEGYTLHVTALFEQVLVSWARPAQPHREVGLAKETLDNRWHWVGLRYNSDPPSLLLEVDKDTQIISNVTWNPELLSPGALEAGGAVLLVGNVFSGCILEGPQLEFHAAGAQVRNVVFGHCPLTTDECIDRKDVLRIQPKDHCYNEPCMRHGTCISRHDRYECHCSARYTGNNCEVDAGDPCASAPCQHAARCREDARGDYVCDCPPNYHGTFCELEVSLDPQCVAGPCRNNASCSVPPGADSYVCACPPVDCENGVCQVSACASGPCGAGGACVEESGGAGFRCVCARGFAPPYCAPAHPPAACAELACPPRSHCAVLKQALCVCDAGYHGAPGLAPDCAALDAACDAGVCQNGALCTAGADHLNCTCAPGYKGLTPVEL